MAAVTSTVIHLGNFGTGIPDIDPDGVGGAENANALVGEIYLTSDMSIQTVTYEDHDSNNFVDFDQSPGPGQDYITYDLGGGSQSEAVDQGVWANIQVIETDGNVINTNCIVFQTPNGETFLTEFSPSLDNLDIESIEVTSILNSFFARISVTNSVDGTIVCFATGSMIETPLGEIPVERLKPRDVISTLDQGPVPIRALYRVDGHHPEQHAPIRLAAGALSPDMPDRPLLVSPQHRVLCRSKLAERMFGADEILVAAKHLVGIPGVTRDAAALPLTYFHIELGQHDIVIANGAYVESCFQGEQALMSLPHMTLNESDSVDNACRLVPPIKKQKQFAERLAKNGHAIFDTDLEVPKLGIKSVSRPAQIQARQA